MKKIVNALVNHTMSTYTANSATEYISKPMPLRMEYRTCWKDHQRVIDLIMLPGRNQSLSAILEREIIYVELLKMLPCWKTHNPTCEASDSESNSSGESNEKLEIEFDIQEMENDIENEIKIENEFKYKCVKSAYQP